MKKLESLNLGFNHIQEIPSSYSNFLNLKSIYLQNNRLSVFPMCLCELKHLDVVDLSENKIEELPESLERLQCIELNMNMNQIKVLPPSLSLCPRLKVLRAEENLLEYESISSEFLKNSQVCVLAVDGNLFQMKDLTNKDGYDQVIPVPLKYHRPPTPIRFIGKQPSSWSFHQNYQVFQLNDCILFPFSSTWNDLRQARRNSSKI
jgi:hypothetical protein